MRTARKLEKELGTVPLLREGLEARGRVFIQMPDATEHEIENLAGSPPGLLLQESLNGARGAAPDGNDLAKEGGYTLEWKTAPFIQGIENTAQAACERLVLADLEPGEYVNDPGVPR